ncbi:hypothetical protein D3C76_1091490 [compost metagenome]
MSWPRPVGHGDQGRQGQQFTLGVPDVVIVQPVRVIPEGTFNLGDDFVTTALDSETVDFRFTQQGRQRTAQILHRHAHLCRLGAIDVHYHLRFIECEVDVDKGELAGLRRALFHPVDHLQQQLVIVGGVDHELKRQALASTRQGRQVEAEDLQPRNALQLGLDIRQDLHLGAAALVPRFEQEAADPRLHAIEAIDLE